MVILQIAGNRLATPLFKSVMVSSALSSSSDRTIFCLLAHTVIWDTTPGGRTNHHLRLIHPFLYGQCALYSSRPPVIQALWYDGLVYIQFTGLDLFHLLHRMTGYPVADVSFKVDIGFPQALPFGKVYREISLLFKYRSM